MIGKSAVLLSPTNVGIPKHTAVSASRTLQAAVRQTLACEFEQVRRREILALQSQAAQEEAEAMGVSLLEEGVALLATLDPSASQGLAEEGLVSPVGKLLTYVAQQQSQEVLVALSSVMDESWDLLKRLDPETAEEMTRAGLQSALGMLVMQIAEKQKSELIEGVSQLMDEGTLLLEQLDPETADEIIHDGRQSPVGKLAISIAGRSEDAAACNLVAHVRSRLLRQQYVMRIAACTLQAGARRIGVLQDRQEQGRILAMRCASACRITAYVRSKDLRLEYVRHMAAFTLQAVSRRIVVLQYRQEQGRVLAMRCAAACRITGYVRSKDLRLQYVKHMAAFTLQAVSRRNNCMQEARDRWSAACGINALVRYRRARQNYATKHGAIRLLQSAAKRVSAQRKARADKETNSARPLDYLKYISVCILQAAARRHLSEKQILVRRNTQTLQFMLIITLTCWTCCRRKLCIYACACAFACAR